MCQQYVGPRSTLKPDFNRRLTFFHLLGSVPHFLSSLYFLIISLDFFASHGHSPNVHQLHWLLRTGLHKLQIRNLNKSSLNYCAHQFRLVLWDQEPHLVHCLQTAKKKKKNSVSKWQPASVTEASSSLAS